MKNTLLHVCRLLLLFLLAVSAGCKSAAFFASPNNMMKKEAVVMMLDGTRKKGLLTITLETSYYPVDFVRLLENGVEEKIYIDLISSYRINQDLYVPKRLVLEYDGPQRLLFVKRLTPDGSRIHLYELDQQQQQRDDGQQLQMYFISLPAFDRMEAWGLGNKNLVPAFNEKMSGIVADCPVLAIKVRNKEKGYFFSQLSLSNTTKKEVLSRIIEEYNRCQ